METISVPTRQIINLQNAVHNLSDKQFKPLQAIYESFTDTINEIDILCSEVNIGNVIVRPLTLTCIHDNALHRYALVKRRAHAGEKIYITKYTEGSPFNSPKYIGRCFIVAETNDDIYQCNMKPFAEIKASNNTHDYSWIIFDDQYMVLEECDSACKIIPFPV